MNPNDLASASNRPRPTVLSGARLPVGLHNMRKPPAEVYLWGELPPRPWVSVIGTRKPSDHGRQAARTVARELSERGVTVVSGGALGVDTEAHRGALDADGRTLVLAPAWFEQAYPSQNRGLFSEILARRGGYLCVNPEGVLLRNPAFFTRNEAMMALSDLVILGECPHKSGARNAVLHAVRLGTRVAVLAFPYATPEAEGSYQEMLSRKLPLIPGLQVALKMLENAGFSPPLLHPPDFTALPEAVTSPRSEPLLDPIGAKILSLVRAGATGNEELCEKSGLEPAVVQHQVLLLTLAGTIAEDERGHLRYTPGP